MKHTHVVLVTGSLAIGGTERNILNLARSLDPSRFSVEVVCSYEGQALEPELRRRGVACTALKRPSVGRPWLVRFFGHNLPFQWRLFRLLRLHREAVIHAFGFPTAYYVVILGRLAGARRLIFSVQDWDVWKKSRLYRWLDTLCSRLAARVIADGAGAARLAVQDQGMAAAKIEVFYDGVETGELRPRRTRDEILSELHVPPDRCVIGTIARLDVKKKGQDRLIQAMPLVLRRAPQCTFVLVGGGPDEDHLRQLAGALPPDQRPVFAGFRTDLADILSALDILVIPSLWESVPKVLLEGMWLRKAVVATTAGDITEMLDNTRGVLVPPGNAQALADAIVPLANDPSRRQALGARAHEYVRARGLTMDQTIRRYETLYEAL